MGQKTYIKMSRNVRGVYVEGTCEFVPKSVHQYSPVWKIEVRDIDGNLVLDDVILESSTYDNYVHKLHNLMNRAEAALQHPWRHRLGSRP